MARGWSVLSTGTTAALLGILLVGGAQAFSGPHGAPGPLRHNNPCCWSPGAPARVTPCGRAAALRAQATDSGAKKAPERVFVFGMGYTGFGLVRAAQARWGSEVELFGTCRSPDKAIALQDAGVKRAHVFNPDDEYMPLRGVALDDLRAATHVLTTIPPVADFSRDPVLEFHAKDLAGSEQLVWAGYLSTTSVYGDHGGEWVTEESETRIGEGHPSYPRLLAEQAWLAQLPAIPSHVFRLAGIYGPGRSALDTVRKSAEGRGRGGGGKAAAEGAGESKWVSRVHLRDICECVMASMEAGRPGSIYNVADDVPERRGVVMQYARELLGLPPSEDEKVAPLDAKPVSARRSSTDSKRVCNARIKENLGVVLRYPSYKEGLKTIHSGDTDPFVTK